MAKQVLSVADFVTIINLLSKEMHDIERCVCVSFEEIDREDFKKNFPDGNVWTVPRPTLADERVQKELMSHPHYQYLTHLKESLQNLNIEVETPDVEVRLDEEYITKSIEDYAEYLKRSNEDE